MSIEEKVQIDYDYLIEYLEDPQNAIGATTSTTLRNITAHNDGNSIYVKKFGLDYEIADVTDIEDPVDANMKFLVYSSETDILLGSRVGGGAFVDGGTVSPAEGCYLKIEASGGAVTVLAAITIDTDVDPGGKTFVCAAETVADGDTLRLYLSDTTSTYYDSEYKHGGARHTPDSSSSLPYFDITTAIADPDATGYTITTVLDSELYDEEYPISIASMILQADEGHTPTITKGVGARITRDMSQLHNNTTSVYFNENGDDAGAGTWQDPWLTVTFTLANRGGLLVVYGGTGATVSNGIFSEKVVGNGTLEAEYGYMPTMRETGIVTGTLLFTNGGALICRGFTFEGNSVTRGIWVDLGGSHSSAYDCTFTDCLRGIKGEVTPVNIYNSYFFNCATGVELEFGQNPRVYNMHKNLFENCTVGTILKGVQNQVETCTATIHDNIFIASSLQITDTFANPTLTGTIDNNLFFNYPGGTGFLINNFDGTFTVTATGNIFHSLGTGLKTDVNITISHSNFYNNTLDTDAVGGAVITNNSEISGDPKLCKITAPYKLGLSADSPCYRAFGTNEDTGPRLSIIEINESDITVNGFIIDGQEFYNNASYKDSADHITNIFKWCSIYDFQGIGLDYYENSVDTNGSVLNCDINNCGNGIKFSRGGNTVQESLIYNNAVYGVHANANIQDFNHCTFFNNIYGLYFSNNLTTAIVKNCIFHANSLRGIYSTIRVFSINYCCITDGAFNVNLTDPSNFTDDPLFKNELPGTEDLDIKTKFGGFSVNSPCLLTASDGKDIGAWDIDRQIEEEAWKKFVLDSNPSNLNDALDSINQARFGGALGSRSLWAKAHKLIFPFEWEGNHYTTERQKDKIRYFSTRIGSREIGLSKLQARLRLRLAPTAHLFNGVSGVIDASNKTLTDSAIDLNDWKYKGYNLAVIFTDDTGMVIDAGAKTGTKAAAGWKIDQRIGYYLKYNGYTYYIKSNTATVLTLSDPFSTLVSATIDYSIEKYFEILKHNEMVYTLIDNDSELIDGTYDYYIDFALTRAMDSKFSHVQPKFAYSKEEWKTGYQLLLEQI